MQTASYRTSPAISPYTVPRSADKIRNENRERVTSPINAGRRDTSNGEIYLTSMTATSTTISADSSKNRSRSFVGNADSTIVDANCGVARNPSGASSQTGEHEDHKFKSEILNSNVVSMANNSSIVTVCPDASHVHRLRIETCDRQTSPAISRFMKDASTSPIRCSWLKTVGDRKSVV